MNTPKLKTLVEIGAVQRASVIYDAVAGGWTVSIVFKTADEEKTEMLERQRGGPRVFATLDAAANFLFSVGIRAFHVSAESWQGKRWG